MNILLISTGDHRRASEAAYRLIQNLKAYGHNCKMLVKQKSIPDEYIIPKQSSNMQRRVFNIS